MHKANKVSIIGAGFVGSATALTLATSGIISDLVLVDVNKSKAEGEMLDIAHGAAFLRSINLTAGDYPDIENSDIVVITAGASQKPDESRLDLIQKNVGIFKQIIPEIVKYAPHALLLIVANPVDITTYISFKLSGFPANRVIGSGTVLDTSRLRYSLAKRFDLDARNIHAYIIGEHGDSEFPSWSTASIANISLEDYCQREQVDAKKLMEHTEQEVRHAAYEIINKKGYTNYAIALAVRRIVEAVLRDERAILTISSYNSEENVYYSVPTLVGRKGVIKKICPNFSTKELEELEHSKTVLKDVIKSIAL